MIIESRPSHANRQRVRREEHPVLVRTERRIQPSGSKRTSVGWASIRTTVTQVEAYARAIASVADVGTWRPRGRVACVVMAPCENMCFDGAVGVAFAASKGNRFGNESMTARPRCRRTDVEGSERGVADSGAGAAFNNVACTERSWSAVATRLPKVLLPTITA